MKPDHTCDLVQDLLPLWLDHTLSQDSQALIQQHLPRGPACRRILADMDAPLTLPPEQDAAPLRTLNHLWQKEVVRVVLGSLAVGTCFLLLTVVPNPVSDALNKGLTLFEEFFHWTLPELLINI